MSHIQVLILTQKAEVKVGKLPLGEVTLKTIQTYFKKKTEVEVLGTYKYKTLTLFLFGFTKGKAGTENKHELPPPHEGIVFGDILLLASKNESDFSEPVLFKVEDYEQFYSKVFGGFEDEEEEEAEEEEAEEEIEDVDGEIEGVIDEEFEVASHCSEEIVEVKKEKKKKASAAQNITFAQYIPPEKQLNETSIRNDLRTNILQNIVKLFNNTLTSHECDTLEQEIYKATLREAESKHIVKDWSISIFISTYKTLMRKIIGNLYSKSYIKNNELMTRYKNKEVSLEDICAMDHYSLFKSKWNERIEHQKLIEKRQIEGNKSMATDQFLCKRCHKRECTYYEMQTRSADEPMTIFINCLNCGQNWRQ